VDKDIEELIKGWTVECYGNKHLVIAPSGSVYTSVHYKDGINVSPHECDHFSSERLLAEEQDAVRIIQEFAHELCERYGIIRRA
jgi:hypothetical protein